MRLGRRKFEGLVEEALARIPPAFRAEVRNVGIEVRPRPGKEARGLGKDLLGLYLGPNRAEMSDPAALPLPPGRIILYQENLEAVAEDEPKLREEISMTLRHEIAHHFGFDDEELEQVWPEGC